MKILITGATGFVGRKVLQYLKEQYDPADITILTSSDETEIDEVSAVNSKHYEFDSDYLLEQGCREVDTILHLGAFTPKSGREGNDILRSDSNISNTEKLLYSNLPNLKKIIFISTLDVYKSTDEVISEETETIPQTMYGWSKLYCEQMIQSFCKEKSITYQILRLGHVYGEGEEKYRKVMPIMIQNAIDDKNIVIYGDGKAIRTFIYIDDVAEAIVNSLKLEEPCFINIVGKETITINGLAEMIVGISGKDLKISHIESVTPNKDFVFDNSKLQKLLGHDLLPLEDGLRKEYAYMKDKGQTA